jgi:6-phosphofructokinase 1
MAAWRTDGGDMKSVAISTGGGDAPGLNAVIHAATLAARRRGWDVWGIRDGYLGLLEPQRYGDGGVFRLTDESVEGITALGGTILGTTNRGHPFHYPLPRADGTVEEVDRSDELVAALRDRGIDAVITAGGDGSLAIAHALSQKGLRIVGVPKTIDNDLDGTVVTFGFETAVAFATECLDRLQTTAASHHRVLVVEVMGRYAGWIALHAGLAGAADAILLPEIPYDLAGVAAAIEAKSRGGHRPSIVVVAEGAHARGGERVVKAGAAIGAVERLGGIGERVAAQLATATGRETRAVVLGHLLRGGSPIAFDRVIALRFGAAAVRALADGVHGVMIALDPPVVTHVPLAEATRRMRTVPLDGDTIRTARELGVCLGDAS